MGLTEKLDLDPLYKSYLFANTPMYLYQHFREHAALEELAKRVSLQELIEEFNQQVNKEPRTIEDVVTAYALLVAITFLDYKQVISALNNLDLSRLDWGNDITSIFRARAIPTKTITIKAKAPIAQKKPLIRIASQTKSIRQPPPKLRIRSN